MNKQLGYQHLCHFSAHFSCALVAFAFAMLLPQLAHAQDQVSSEERYVSIQMAPVEGAKYYEVEVSPFETRGLVPGQLLKIFHEDPNVYVRLKPGRYAVRTRSLVDVSDSPGAWSTWVEFNVAFKKLEKLYPADGEKIIPKSPDGEKIIFHWPQVAGAEGYYFILKQNGKTVEMSKAEQNWIESKILPLNKYEWAAIPLPVKNSGIEPVEYSFEVLNSPTEGRTVIIDVAGDPAAQLYHYELVKFSKENLPGSPSLFESKDTRFKMKLEPGLYELRVRNILLNQSSSEWSKPERFYVRFNSPKYIAPLNKEEIDPGDNWHNRVELKWENVPGASKYLFRVLDKKTKNIIDQREVTEPNATVDVEHEHTYEWSVVPLSHGEKPDTLALQNAPAWEFTVPNYIKLALTSAEESSHYYGWYRHWVSRIHYVGRNYDQNSIYDQLLLAGTGEAALGWWNRKTRWGFLVDSSLSGFNIEGRFFNYMSAGFNVGRRVLIAEFSRLRYWVGVSYTEFPDFVVSPYDPDQLTFTRAKTLGPQAQISYLGDFSEEQGYHIYFHTYWPAIGLKTPNGNTFQPGPSLRFGLLWTWNYREDMKLMAGYSYRYETFGYTSRSYLGARNSSEYGGHFLNLAVEFGLGRQKFK